MGNDLMRFYLEVIKNISFIPLITNYRSKLAFYYQLAECLFFYKTYELSLITFECSIVNHT